MFKNIFKEYVYPIVTLAGGAIGVGFLSLPYIALKVGIWPMLFYFVVLTGLVLVMNVIFAKISLKTPDFKRFPGFVEFYLGKKAKLFSLVFVVLGSVGVLLSYLIIGGQFLAAVLSPIFGGTLFLYVFLYFIAASAVVFFGVNLIAKIEFGALVLILFSLALIFIKGFGHIHVSQIFLSPGLVDWKTSFLPYGTIIFSLWTAGLIPEIEEMVSKKKKSLQKIIILATLITAIFYVAFIFLILGISGQHTTQSAFGGLAGSLDFEIMMVALFVGVLSTFVGFVLQGLFLKKVLMFDVKIKPFSAWVFTCFPPMILLLLGLDSFIPLISFIGGVFLGISGLLILWMYKKIGGKGIVVYPLAIFFILGIIYELLYVAPF